MNSSRGLPRALSRGFAPLGLILILVIGLAVIGGGAYYIAHRNDAFYNDLHPLSEMPAAPTPNQTTTNRQATHPSPVPQTSTSPTATIHQSSLAATSTNPTITGMVSGTTAISVVVFKGNITAPKASRSVMPSVWLSLPYVTGGGSDGRFPSITISKGRWSYSTSGYYTGYDFSNGTYTVGVYDDENSTHNLLASGILTISGLPPAATCILTASPTTVNVGKALQISWTSQNATRGELFSEGTGTNPDSGLNDRSLTPLVYQEPVGVNGSQTFTPQQVGSFVFTLDIQGIGGGNTSCSATVSITAK